MSVEKGSPCSPHTSVRKDRNERDTATLQTSLEQIEAKRATLADMDTKVQATIEDADALETEILDTEEICTMSQRRLHYQSSVGET